MSKFPEYKHTKSHEYFDRAIKVIPPVFTVTSVPQRAFGFPFQNGLSIPKKQRVHIFGTLTATST